MTFHTAVKSRPGFDSCPCSTWYGGGSGGGGSGGDVQRGRDERALLARSRSQREVWDTPQARAYNTWNPCLIFLLLSSF